MAESQRNPQPGEDSLENAMDGLTLQPSVLTTENVEHHNQITGGIKMRQFSCRKNKRSWWKNVNQTKAVSKCWKCKVKFDALPPDKEFGVGKFNCDCGNTFTSIADGTTMCPCFSCQAEVRVDHIIPGRKAMRDRPSRDRGEGNDRPRHRHWCALCRGNGKCPGFKAIVHYSRRHDSTGSTVSPSISSSVLSFSLPPSLDGTFEDDEPNAD